MPVDYDRGAVVPLRVRPELRARLDAVRALAPAWAPLSRNGAGVAALLLGLDALERLLRADPTAAARLLAGEPVEAPTLAAAPATPAAPPPTRDTDGMRGTVAGRARPVATSSTPRADVVAELVATVTGEGGRWTLPMLARVAGVELDVVEQVRAGVEVDARHLTRVWNAAKGSPPTAAAPAPTADDVELRARLAAVLGLEPDKHPRDRVWNLRRIAAAIGSDGKSLAAFRDGKPGLGATRRAALAALLATVDVPTG